MALLLGCFFFQAEDGIRDIGVTGVQTCALPISGSSGVHLHVSSKNLHARTFYKKLGFDEISVFKDELILAIHF